MNIIQREDLDNKTIHIDSDNKLSLKVRWKEPRQIGYPMLMSVENGELVLIEEGTKRLPIIQESYFIQEYNKIKTRVPDFFVSGSNVEEEIYNNAKYPHTVTKEDGEYSYLYLLCEFHIPQIYDQRKFTLSVLPTENFDLLGENHIDSIRPMGWYKESFTELPSYTDEQENSWNKTNWNSIAHPDYPNLFIDFDYIYGLGKIKIRCTDLPSLFPNEDTPEVVVRFGAVVWHKHTEEDSNSPDIEPLRKDAVIQSITLTATDEEIKRNIGGYGGRLNDNKTVTWSLGSDMIE